jgi:hypothetical protein
MKALLKELHEQLADMIAAIAANQNRKPDDSTPRRDILPHLHAIERLRVKLSADCPPRLAHYLGQRSYLKALRFLEGREGENERGLCKNIP